MTDGWVVYWSGGLVRCSLGLALTCSPLSSLPYLPSLSLSLLSQSYYTIPCIAVAAGGRFTVYYLYGRSVTGAQDGGVNLGLHLQSFCSFFFFF